MRLGMRLELHASCRGCGVNLGDGTACDADCPRLTRLPLTAPMKKALVIALAQAGGIDAGATVRSGRLVWTNARTLDALIQRGLATKRFTSEGGYGALLTDRGILEADKVARLLNPRHLGGLTR